MEKVLMNRIECTSDKGRHYFVEFWGGETAEVDLISYPTDALETLVRLTRGYAGNYTMDPVTPEETERFLKDIPRTALQTQLEFLSFTFLVRDVPRSLTHQMVRTRIGAAYVQESTRFMGARDVYKILVPRTAHKDRYVDTDYVEGNIQAICAYENMVAKEGIASQDARNLFPHGMLTNIFVSYTLKTLAHVYNQRFCCAAETNWYALVRDMKTCIKETCGPEISSFITAPIDRGENCGYNSSLDRPCVWRSRNVTSK